MRIDLALARRAYAVCLIHVLERLAQVQTSTTTAIGDILGELRPVRPSLLQRLRGAWRGFKYG